MSKPKSDGRVSSRLAMGRELVKSMSRRGFLKNTGAAALGASTAMMGLSRLAGISRASTLPVYGDETILCGGGDIANIHPIHPFLEGYLSNPGAFGWDDMAKWWDSWEPNQDLYPDLFQFDYSYFFGYPPGTMADPTTVFTKEFITSQQQDRHGMFFWLHGENVNTRWTYQTGPQDGTGRHFNPYIDSLAQMVRPMDFYPATPDAYDPIFDYAWSKDYEPLMALIAQHTYLVEFDMAPSIEELPGLQGDPGATHEGLQLHLEEGMDLLPDRVNPDIVTWGDCAAVYGDDPQPVKMRGWYVRGAGLPGGRRALIFMWTGGSGEQHDPEAYSKRDLLASFHQAGFDVAFMDKRSMGTTMGFSNTTITSAHDLYRIMKRIERGEFRMIRPGEETVVPGENLMLCDAEEMPVLTFGTSHGSIISETIATAYAIEDTIEYGDGTTLNAGDFNFRGVLLDGPFALPMGGCRAFTDYYTRPYPWGPQEEFIGRFMGGSLGFSYGALMPLLWSRSTAEGEPPANYSPAVIYNSMDRWPAFFSIHGLRDFALAPECSVIAYNANRGYKRLLLLDNDSHGQFWCEAPWIGLAHTKIVDFAIHAAIIDTPMNKTKQTTIEDEACRALRLPEGRLDAFAHRLHHGWHKNFDEEQLTRLQRRFPLAE